LARICINSEGMIIQDSQSWPEYWRPVLRTEMPAVMTALDRLHEIWIRYIRSNFAKIWQADYCYNYFNLLDTVFKACRERNESELMRQALHTVLAFECFGICALPLGNDIHAAGTSTLRNPAYLLTKLRMPAAMDGPQFLPLITASGSNPVSSFYHYRQHRLSVDSDNSILLYLSTTLTLTGRERSFAAINRIERAISRAIDPRADERASRIAQKIIIPLLNKASSNSRQCHPGGNALELIDIGSGSGMMAIHLFQEIIKHGAANGARYAIRAWMLDLTVAEPIRIGSWKKILPHMDCIASISADYKYWSGANCGPKNGNGLRVGLASRFFNSMSEFQICPVLEDPVVSTSAELNEHKSSVAWKKCSPVECLNPESRNVHNLVVSNKRIPASRGRSYLQISLSPYYHALMEVCLPRPNAGQGDGDEKLFLPIRKFRDECLISGSAKNVLETLFENCDLAIVQDADMRPQDVEYQRGTTRKAFASAIDMTNALGLRNHYSYVFLRNRNIGIELLKGKRLW